MKFCHLLYCCFIISTASCQDSSIVTSWTKLTTAFINRATAFENITLSVSKIIKVDSVILKDVSERKMALKTLLDIPRLPDSNFIHQVVEENKKTRASFWKVMDLMLSKPSFASTKESADIQTQLMTIENKIFYTKKQYNTLLLSINRQDLLYPR
jgi:hypothetical protein